MRRPARQQAHRERDAGGRDEAAAEQALRTVLRIAAEELVAAVSRQHDLHVRAGELGEEEQHGFRRLGHRLVAVPGEPRQHVDEVPGADDELVVVGPVPLGREPRSAALVVERVVEADRERRHAGRAGFVHQAEHRGGVDAAGEQHADGNVAHQPPLDRLPEQRAQAPGIERLLCLRRRQAPVRTDARRLPVVVQKMAGRELLHAREERARGADVALEEELRNLRLVEHGPPARDEMHRTCIRAEREPGLGVPLPALRLLPAHALLRGRAEAPPGHLLHYDRKTAGNRPYWSLSTSEAEEPSMSGACRAAPGSGRAEADGRRSRRHAALRRHRLHRGARPDARSRRDRGPTFTDGSTILSTTSAAERGRGQGDGTTTTSCSSARGLHRRAAAAA